MDNKTGESGPVKKLEDLNSKSALYTETRLSAS